jgi:hypothetical protein
VAVRSDHSKDWVSYIFDPAKSQRTLFAANGETPAAIAVLRTDFGL